MDFTIREAERKDISQLIKRFTEFSVFEKKPDRMFNTEEKMLRQMDFFNAFVVELADGKIVGYLSYFFCYYTWSGKAIYMDDFYVMPEYRGNAFGKQLIDRLIDLAKKEDCYKIRWQVSKWNGKAIKFYTALGAEIEDIELDCDLILE